MARGDKAHVDIADPNGLVIGYGLAVLRAAADLHDPQRFPSGKHGPVASAGMVRMTMRDHRLRLWSRRIDPCIRRSYVDPFRVGFDPGTQSRHRELYRRKRRTVPLRGQANGRIAGWNHGN